MTGKMPPMTTELERLGERVQAARIQQRYSVVAASSAAGVARDTWKKVERGLSVHDANRAKVLDFLGLSEGQRSMRPVTPEQLENLRQYVLASDKSAADKRRLLGFLDELLVEEQPPPTGRGEDAR